MLPIKVTKVNDHHKAGLPAATASTLSTLSMKANDPYVTSANATNRAMRSSDLRQKMSAPTANEVTAKTSSTTIRYPAKKSAERPIDPSSRTFAGVSASGWHAARVHTIWSRANSTGMLTAIQNTVSTATATQAMRASRR